MRLSESIPPVLADEYESSEEEEEEEELPRKLCCVLF